MNIVLVISVLIVALFALVGFKKGMIKTVFSICSIFVAIILTIFISPYISRWMRGNEDIMIYFSEKVGEALNIDSFDTGNGDLEDLVSSLNLPDSIKATLVDNNTGDVYAALDIEKGNIQKYIRDSVACIVINALGFIATFLILLIILWVLCFALDIISRLPLLHQINKVLGLFAGIVQGVIVLWLLCILLTIFSGFAFAHDIYSAINQSWILSLLYNNNLILKTVTNIPKLLSISI